MRLDLDRACNAPNRESMIHDWSFHHMNEPGPEKARFGDSPQELDVEMRVVCRDNNFQHID